MHRGALGRDDRGEGYMTTPSSDSIKEPTRGPDKGGQESVNIAGTKLSAGTAGTLLRLAGIVMAFLLSALVLLAIGASPLDAFNLIIGGAFSSTDKLAYVLTAWAPILL